VSLPGEWLHLELSRRGSAAVNAPFAPCPASDDARLDPLPPLFTAYALSRRAMRVDGDSPRHPAAVWLTSAVLHVFAVMERRSAFRPQRVLIVDDTADLRELWKLWLTGWGFAVEEARNGAEAVEKARTHPPDLILMDYAMPVLDGDAAIRLLASDRATAHVPVLAMSAHTSAIASDTAGSRRFLPKPTEPDRLLEHIRQALRNASRTLTQ
jgi:two-component system cell cycle response regulator DivK